MFMGSKNMKPSLALEPSKRGFLEYRDFLNNL